MEQLVTSIQAPEAALVTNKFSYAYDLDLSHVPDEHKEGVQSTFDTLYRTMAAVFENLVVECEVPLREATKLLPQGLEVMEDTAHPNREAQYSFSF